MSAFFSRPLWPVDETRYASVAWEMWLSGDWLVPHLNAAPYSHKPPLLFWLIGLGWQVVGVSSFWLRLVPALFAPASLYLSAMLARELWPDDRRTAQLAPLVLVGTGVWLFFSTAVMFDMLLGCCVLAALWAMAASPRLGMRAWLVAGLSLGLGVLAKGPVVFLYTVPVAALAPWWAQGPDMARRASWFGGLGIALGLAAAIALAWAVPAAVAGGDAYGHALLWGQIADRIVEASAHRRPWWWYLPMLPALLLPWTAWPGLWRGARLADPQDTGLRFCLAWAVPSLVLLSTISGKQVHYLLPVVPALALAGARLLSGAHPVPGDGRLPALLLAVLAGALLLVRYGGVALGLPGWSARVPLTLVGILLAGAAMLAGGLWGSMRARTLTLSASMVLAAVAAYTIGSRVASPYYDVMPTALYLREAEAHGHPLAYVGGYHGEFNFVGRLHRPLAELRDSREAVVWLQEHPDGRLVMLVRDWSEVPDSSTKHQQPYRGDQILVVLAKH